MLSIHSSVTGAVTIAGNPYLKQLGGRLSAHHVEPEHP
jgi:hypothetical protein